MEAKYFRFYAKTGKELYYDMKPQPAHLAFDYFDTDAVEQELVTGLKSERGIIELILRDTYLRKDPSLYKMDRSSTQSY